MIKKVIILVLFISLNLLTVEDCYRTSCVSYATEIESEIEDNSNNDKNAEDNSTVEGENNSEDDQTNESADDNDTEDETSSEDRENQLDIECNEVSIEDIKNLSIFNKYGKVLEIGDEGELVKSLHILLRWLNYDVDETSTVFTLQTEEAVIQFQEDHSMKGIGVVDKLTYIRLNDFIYSSKLEFDYVDFDVKMGPTEDYWIMINKTTNVLQLYKGKNRLKIYPIATGRYYTFTPEGKFEVANKLVNAGWKDVPGGVASNPLGSRWMGLNIKNNWTYGIHGVGRPESIGTYASAGCIRMYNFDSEELYDLVSVHTPVWIGRTDQLEEWIMELNNTYDEMIKEQEESSIELYEEVMMLFLQPYINETLVECYGESFDSNSKTVDIISIEHGEEREDIVTIILEVLLNQETELATRDRIIITIDLTDAKIEVYEHLKAYKYLENSQEDEIL